MTALTLTEFLTRHQHEPWSTVLRRDPCSYCGRLEADIPGGTGRKWREGNARKITIEHVVPRGLDIPRPPGTENKVAACWTCNHARNNLPLLAYLLWRRTQDIRFLPGPHNVRNRIMKAEHRRRLERKRLREFAGETQAHGLKWSLRQAFGEPAADPAVPNPTDSPT